MYEKPKIQQNLFLKLKHCYRPSAAAVIIENLLDRMLPLIRGSVISVRNSRNSASRPVTNTSSRYSESVRELIAGFPLSPPLTPSPCSIRITTKRQYTTNSIR